MNYWQRIGYDAETGYKLDEMILCANIAGIAIDRFAVAASLARFEIEKWQQTMERVRYLPLFTKRQSALAMGVLVVVLVLLILVLR